MRHKTRLLAVGGLILCLGGMVLSAQAQGACTLQTLAGSYVMYERGSSSILDPSQPAEYQPYYTGAMAPFVTISNVTFNDAGIGDGYYWIRLGSINPGFEPIPLHVEITEMNEDCTGKMRYEVSLPGIPSATIEERLVVLDNGRETRTVPTSITGGISDMAWIGEGHRIGNTSAPVRTCGPHTAQGTFVVTCESLIGFSEDLAMTDTLVAVTHTSMAGTFTGTLYEKAGPLSIETPIVGTVAVEPDCSATFAMEIPELFPGAVVPLKGVYFNEGKENYQFPIDMPSAFCRGKRVGP